MSKNINKSKIRCAIYTRTSCKKELKKEANSQRLSGEKYILSKKNEGLILVNDQYDDIGYSEKKLNRPALKRLLNDVKTKKIDRIIVYKIDRLTRSSDNLSKIIKILNKYHVGLVDIAQGFSTISSSERLVLDAILCFAKYEKEPKFWRIKNKLYAYYIKITRGIKCILLNFKIRKI